MKNYGPPLVISPEQREVLVTVAFAVAIRRAEVAKGCIEYRTETGLAPAEGRYGKVALQTGERIYTHRLAYEYHHGPIPDGLVIRHRCDNPPCMNIDHLLAGTSKDNLHDAIDRGQWRPTRGDRNNRSTMTVEAVRELRRLARDGWTHRELAARYGISTTSVSNIRTGVRWGWVEEVPA